MIEQTLQVELKNTLQDAPLVLNPVSSALNREEIPSVQNKVLVCNNPEVDLLPRYRGNRTRESLLCMYLEVLPSPSFLQRRRGSYSFLVNDKIKLYENIGSSIICTTIGAIGGTLLNYKIVNLSLKQSVLISFLTMFIVCSAYVFIDYKIYKGEKI